MTDGRPSREELSRRFVHQGRAFVGHSPLYKALAERIAEDPEVLDLASHARSVPLTGLFFGAIHALLLGGVDHPLARFYASLSSNVPETEDPYPAFRSFCAEHAGEIRKMIETRRVQTNEVRRCASLLPALGLVAEQAGSPLALIEVGTSAGLNLYFDRFAYRYGDGRAWGDPDSPVRISCAVRGEQEVPLPACLLGIASRIGLDLNPLDVRDPESVRWLKALIWPEEYGHRAPLLENAIAIARRNPPTLLRGDALDLLPEALERAPAEAVPCVFHTFTLNQFPQEARERFAKLLRRHARKRDLYRISIEWLGADETPILKLSAFERGKEETTSLAKCDDHGEWIEWIEG